MSLENTKVYVPDDEDVWRQAEVLQLVGDEKLVVRVHGLAGGEGKEGRGEQEIDLGKIQDLLRDTCGDQDGLVSLPLVNEDVDEKGVDDMCTLNYLHEPAILYNLRQRFFAATPYTYTGDICVAVNPYRWIDGIYDVDKRQVYVDEDRKGLPPHVYATSAAALRGMRAGRDQSMLVSGESGAGKTETTKIIMDHLASTSARDNDDVIKRVLQSNPLLESFGNAKTVRNDNSSRF
eukprot:g5250.t1